MRSVCICFSGFLETQEHSFICNCHLQLIIAWYVLYINSVTFYTCSLERRLSSSANTTTGKTSKWTLVYLFGPKTACSPAKEMYTNTKSQHVCACRRAYSALFQRSTAQTCTELASDFLTAVGLSGIRVRTLVTVKKEEGGTRAGIWVCVCVRWHKRRYRFPKAGPAAKGAVAGTAAWVPAATQAFRTWTDAVTLVARSEMSASEYIHLLCWSVS